jgi:nitrite reductase (NADH) large subunit
MRYVIIGNGAAANAAATAIRTMDPAGEVLIFAEEPEPAYYRPLITNLLQGDLPKEIFFHQEAASPGKAELQLGKRIVGLDAGRKHIALQDGESYAYDRLLLATGASAIVPDLRGWTGPGTYVLRTLAEARALARAGEEAKKAIIIGAGRVGLKAALALRHRGLQVTVVEQDAHLAPMQFDAIAGEILAQALEDQGLCLIFGQTVTAVSRSGDRVQGADLADGRWLEADMVVAAVGVRPNVELADRAGLAVNRGILVNKRLGTSAPDIYAAGDAVETTDMVTGQSIVSGLWTNAVEMGRIAGCNMAGGSVEYPGAFAVLNSLDLAGIPTVAIGLTNLPPGGEYQVYQNRRGKNYRKLVVKEGVLVGVLLVGDIEGAGVYTGLIRKKAKISDIADTLEHPRFGLASWLSSKIPKARKTNGSKNR